MTRPITVELTEAQCKMLESAAVLLLDHWLDDDPAWCSDGEARDLQLGWQELQAARQRSEQGGDDG